MRGFSFPSNDLDADADADADGSCKAGPITIRSLRVDGPMGGTTDVGSDSCWYLLFWLFRSDQWRRYGWAAAMR